MKIQEYTNIHLKRLWEKGLENIQNIFTRKVICMDEFIKA